jgi:hypothetical protein
VAVGRDGTVYVGLAGPQSVVAVDPDSGAIRTSVVLDSPDIASTKELVVLRTDRKGERLFIANGSDESATILSIPDLGVLREITMEGETVRDIAPDPAGRYVYLLGRNVHVFDEEGDSLIKTLPIDSVMAMATSSDGALLAVVTAERIGTVDATMVVFFDAATLTELRREPLQTEKVVEAAMFAGRDKVIVALSRDTVFEKRVAAKPAAMTGGPFAGSMRVSAVGDLVNVFNVCLPLRSGPQIATFTGSDSSLVYAERRCSSSGTSIGSARAIQPASLYGIDAWAVQYDATRNAIVATDPAGFLTLYNVPRPAVAR